MTYRFGVFEFDNASGELRKSGRGVALEPQPARALGVLLSRADQLVTRDQLKEAVWGKDTHVDFDRGLAYCISEIRTALGDSGDSPRFIQTLPKKGYRFVARDRRDPARPWRTHVHLCFRDVGAAGCREGARRRASGYPAHAWAPWHSPAAARAGRRTQAEPVMKYLETLGDAGRRTSSQPIDAADRYASLGNMSLAQVLAIIS